VVTVAYVAIAGGSAFVLMPKHRLLWFGGIAACTAILIVIGLLKGEKPRWRWGKD
jgi:hypothetical protein